jgi:hypothetical protein
VYKRQPQTPNPKPQTPFETPLFNRKGFAFEILL